MSGKLSAEGLAALFPEHYAALLDYAKEHGRRWKRDLELDWYNARAIGRRGGLLHYLRNHPGFGPTGLTKFKLPKN